MNMRGNIQEEFKKVAFIESDCGTSSNGGYLECKSTELQSSFVEAYNKLKRNEISEIVKTESGYHLILRLN